MLKKETYLANGRIERAENYKIDFAGRFFESLEVLECIDEKYIEAYAHGDLRRKDAFRFKKYKLYRCRCYLCGAEYTVKCSQLQIRPPDQYGVNAYNGFWGGVQCHCHDPITSFQWIANKLLFDNDIHYRVEYSFPDLYGCRGGNLLRFDFAVLNEDGSLKCLIECQGEQHFKPIEEYGGEQSYREQKLNDERKREHCKKHSIHLIEISYKDKKIEKIEAILKSNGIIKDREEAHP